MFCGKCGHNISTPSEPVLRAYFDTQEADGDLDIKDKVKRSTAKLGLDETKTFPYLLELLSVDDSGLAEIS